jgi:hypothetical protein
VFRRPGKFFVLAVEMFCADSIYERSLRCFRFVILLLLSDSTRFIWYETSTFVGCFASMRLFGFSENQLAISLASNIEILF